MKKIGIIILIAALAASVAACSIGKDTDPDSADNYKSIIDPIDIASVKALNHNLFEANTAEQILENHKSYSVSRSIPDTDEPDEFHYVTKEITYDEWSNGYREYTKDRVSYISNYDEDPEKCYAQYGININDELPSRFAVFPKTEEEAFDCEKDIFDKAYVKDGMMHVLSHYSEKGVAEWMENYYGKESAGEQIFTELIVDTATYEAVELTVTLEKDGEKKTAYSASVEYDTPLPEAAKAMVSFFERPSENMMNFKVIADKGTERELTFDVTVPKNVECTWIYDGSSVMFDDPGYTALTHWDRMSDKTAYIVRDPDEKTNEKYREAYENLLKQSKDE